MGAPLQCQPLFLQLLDGDRQFGEIRELRPEGVRNGQLFFKPEEYTFRGLPPGAPISLTSARILDEHGVLRKEHPFNMHWAINHEDTLRVKMALPATEMKTPWATLIILQEPTTPGIPSA